MIGDNVGMMILGIFCLGGWLVSTALVDFFTIPTLFRSGIDFYQAGEIGMSLFKKFNYLEIFLGLGLSFGLWNTLAHKFSRVVLVVLSMLPFLYAFYFTPSISARYVKMKEVEQTNPTLYQELFDAHQFFHKLYVQIDGVKLILLVIIFALLLFKNKKGQLV